jgi:hypothetical protein
MNNIGKKIVFVWIACCALFMASAQQPTIVHDENAQVRQVGDFHAVRVATGIHLYLSQGGPNTVAVSANDLEFRDKIRTEVKDGILNIYLDNAGWNLWNKSGKQLKAYVSCAQLDKLHASSGANVDVDGTLKSPNLALEFSSGAQFTGKVEVGSLDLQQNSGARATISGTATRLKADASSGSSLHGYDLVADDCSIAASSGGKVDITVQKGMTVSAHSGGHVSYRGAGVISQVSTGSGGSVSRR